MILFQERGGSTLREHERTVRKVDGRRWLRMWVKPSFEEVSLCAEVTAYVYTK
jgi:coenzyme PQQ precursor peptide PqqA